MKSPFAHRLVALLALSLALGPLAADDRTKLDWAARLDFSLSSPAYLSWLPGGQSSASGILTLPWFRGKGFFFDSNFLKAGLETRLSSNNLELASGFALRLVQPLTLEWGASLGSGWTTNIAESRRMGLAINPSDEGDPVEVGLGGYVWRAWASPRMLLSVEQFVHNPWFRIYLEADPRFEYQALNAAKAGEAWFWGGDAGMNFNGFKFKPSLYLGWRPPLYAGPRDFAVGIEGDWWLGEVASSSPADKGGWGSDMVLPTLAARGSWSLDAWSTVSVRAFMGSYISWTEASVKAHRYFGKRVFDERMPYFGIAANYIYEY